MKQLLAMLSRAADGAMLIDETGTVVFWNKAAQRLLGYHAGEVCGRPCHDVFRGETLGGHSLCSPACGIGRTLACGRAVHNFDMQTRTKAGRPIWLNISSLPVPSRKKGRFLVTHLFRDITKQARIRQLATELRSALYEQEGEPAPATPLTPTSALGPAVKGDQVPALPLSKREGEVLLLMASGHETKDIADTLCISLATARNHIQHILEKLGAHSRLQALAIAFHPGERSS
jgi:PAS domain S-box-containing protein